jgi:hypothetical protein
MVVQRHQGASMKNRKRSPWRPETRAARWACALVFGLLALACPVAMAQEGLIGFVKTASADASVVVDGKSFKAQAGMPLQAGFIVRTGPQGRLGLTLRDNTLLSFGPNTEFVVDEYLYVPSQGNLKLSARLIKGSLQYVSGVIAKLKPEAVAIRYPTGVVGVRGTEFLLLVEEEEKS